MLSGKQIAKMSLQLSTKFIHSIKKDKIETMWPCTYSITDCILTVKPRNSKSVHAQYLEKMSPQFSTDAVVCM